MMFRDHPFMTRKSGFQSWPPRWTTTHQEKNDKPFGEVGTLEEVMTSNLIDNKVFMFMHYQGCRYMGFMSFDDTQFCHDIYILLKSNLGLSIKQVGDLDISQTH